MYTTIPFIRIYQQALWPNLAICYTLGTFSKPGATIILTKLLTHLRQFLKRCQNLSFYWRNPFWAIFVDIWGLFTGHTVSKAKKSTVLSVQLAITASHFGIPFYVAAPTTTIDLSTMSGADIPIEDRSADEITLCKCSSKARIPPEGCSLKTHSHGVYYVA